MNDKILDKNLNMENIPIRSFKKGNKIHIKKANRGKFTDYCGGKVTSECIARGKSSPNPAIRKRATFAANARKWKHENGGVLKFQNSGQMPKNENEIRPGESVAQWRARLKAQAKERHAQEPIEKAKLDPDYGGELEPAIVIHTIQKTQGKNSQFWNAIKDPKNWWHLRDYLSRKGYISRKEVPIKEMSADSVYIDQNNWNTNYFADLTKNAYMVHNNRPPKNTKSILGNDFIEVSNPHVHTAGEWKKMSPDTEISDKHFPLSNIKVFYGTEDGVLKIQPLQDFNDTTLVVPGRSKLKPITGIEGLSEEEYNKRKIVYDSLVNAQQTYNRGIHDRLYTMENNARRNLDSIYTTRYLPNRNIDDFNYLVEDEINKDIEKKYSIGQYNGRLNTYDWLIDSANNTPLLFNPDYNYGQSPIRPSTKIAISPKWITLRNAFRNYYRDWTNFENSKLHKTVQDSLDRGYAKLDSLRKTEPHSLTFYSGDEIIPKDELFNESKLLLGNKAGSFFVFNNPTLTQDNIDSMRRTINEGGDLFPQLLDAGSYGYIMVNSDGLTNNQREKYMWDPKESAVILGELLPQKHKQGGKINKFQFGNIMPAVIDQYTNNPAPMQFPDWKNGDKCPTGECAFASNGTLRTYFGVPVYGNAWDLNGDPMFQNNTPKPMTFSKQSYLDYLHKSADSFASGFDFKQLNPNNLYRVNMYYNTSPALEKAYPTGNGTHTGYLQFKDGQWQVVHNIHGTMYVDKLNDILGGNQKNYGLLNVYEVPEFNRADAYRKQLEDYIQQNPMGLWQDNDEAAKSRMWLRKNNPEDLDAYYQGLTAEQQKQVDPRFRPKK